MNNLIFYQELIGFGAGDFRASYFDKCEISHCRAISLEKNADITLGWSVKIFVVLTAWLLRS